MIHYILVRQPHSNPSDYIVCFNGITDKLSDSPHLSTLKQVRKQHKLLSKEFGILNTYSIYKLTLIK